MAMMAMLTNEESKTKHVPIENILKMSNWEQFVHRVVDYTSKYNNSNSYYYSPINLMGKCVKYPSYGDFPEAYSLRSYGHWWKDSESYQIDYRPQDVDPLGAEDFITLEFQDAVVPRNICIYEIYNPGAVVRIWGKLLYVKEVTWILLWEGRPQYCPHIARKFHPSIRKVNYWVNTIRLEFNQSHLQYHSSIDAVLLGGYRTNESRVNMMMVGLVNNFEIEKKVQEKRPAPHHICDRQTANNDLFLNLPYEVIIHIFQYLDLKSLSKCAQVNKRWNEASSDPVLYQNLSLKTYWYLIKCSTIGFFMQKCKTFRKLDLSWCGNEVEGFGDQLVLLLRRSNRYLTHLSLGNCKYLNNEIVAEISCCAELIDLRLKNSTHWVHLPLNDVNKLVSLDLSLTDIQDADLIKILKGNPNLKHIIIDLCEKLVMLDQVVEALVEYNKDITTWSSWKTFSLTADGVKNFRNCPNIRELDLGWCLFNKDPGDCLEHIAEGCRQLKRLILSEWRGANEYHLMSVIMACKELTQLDLLGIKNVSVDVCEKALLLLPKLRLLEISYCDSIRQEEVEIWRHQYPHITIQRSCQYEVTDYLN